MNFEDSIAHKAHGLVHGHRAKDYGHPRFDFRIIAKVWSGLLADKFKEGEEIDEYRVAVLMTGLKLARLVKSPEHNDSRVDTIGYMLTMERLDEPTETLTDAQEKCAGFCGKDYCTSCGGDGPGNEDNDGYKVDWSVQGQSANLLTFTNLKLWFEPGETKYVNGQGIVNDDKDCGKIIVIPIAPGTNDLTISPHPPAKCDEHNAEHECTVKEVHSQKPFIEAVEKYFEGKAEKSVHSHQQQEPCMPPCPVWAEGRPAFGFTGEQVEFKRHGNG